jgi:hypothetical protein
VEDILSQKAAQTIQCCSPDDNCNINAPLLYNFTAPQLGVELPG